MPALSIFLKKPYDFPILLKIMASPINREILVHLAELGRIELQAKEEERLMDDLKKIMDYFEELTALDTTGIAPIMGGTEITNSFREDTERENTNRGAGTDAFPESQDGYLKVPNVFGK